VARPRNPERDKSKERWLESGGILTTKELALEAGVPESRIRKWKSEDNWNKELAASRKRGGQRGNKNAVGHGAPLRNKNAETHGAYSTIHLNDLSEADKLYIGSITLDAEENMLRELQLLIAKANDLQRKIKKLETENEGTLHTDKVIEMIVPKSDEKIKNNKAKLEELLVQRDNILYELQALEKPSKTINIKLEKCEAEIEVLRDSLNDAENYNSLDPKLEGLKPATTTIIKASPFDRAMKLEAELNKTHGRIIKLIDSIKAYELEVRRIDLEERKYNLSKQKLTGAFEIDPETGEINDSSGSNDEEDES